MDCFLLFRTSSTTTVPNSAGDAPLPVNSMAGNPVGELQELTQKRLWPPPIYDFTSEQGPPHAREFICTVRLWKFTEQGVCVCVVSEKREQQVPLADWNASKQNVVHGHHRRYQGLVSFHIVSIFPSIVARHCPARCKVTCISLSDVLVCGLTLPPPPIGIMLTCVCFSSYHVVCFDFQVLGNPRS